MLASEVRRKTASVAAIGAVIAASVWLRPSPEPPAVPPRAGILVQSPRSESPLRVPVQSQVQAPVQSPVQSRFRVSSDRGRTVVRVSSDPGRSGVRPGSASGYVATQLHGTIARQELRTLPARIAVDVVAHPSVAATRLAPGADGHVSRAFASAGRHTAAGFRTAACALRSVF